MATFTAGLGTHSTHTYSQIAGAGVPRNPLPFDDPVLVPAGLIQQNIYNTPSSGSDLLGDGPKDIIIRTDLRTSASNQTKHTDGTEIRA
ncbi:hypothetical protein TrLO_g9863 [Triparma laevis f. longispina]|uniref:Uncharacterized protein n=1 Tax=Triparma laevis f. longispina TaxID=1714387 RepID=A0A9W7KT19_9STRA|nr:hypothetical protein TrLO_g9863 [Triparma laevis f. longispina]